MPAATMCVAHAFEVVQQAKVASVVRLGFFDPDRRHLVDSNPNPKPWLYMHLLGGVGVVFLFLITPDLRLWHTATSSTSPMPGESFC